MSARPRKLRYPSSGPFMAASQLVPPPEVGDGTPGVEYRFLGASVPQTFPNAGPQTQLVNFRDYENTVDDSSPAFPHGIVVPKWVDVEIGLMVESAATITVTPELRMTHQFATAVVRPWVAFTAGVNPAWQVVLNERLLWLPDVGDPDLVYSSWSLNLTLAADAGDVILNNPQCWAKFTVYQQPIDGTV
jgi:hypothetical protein